MISYFVTSPTFGTKIIIFSVCFYILFSKVTYNTISCNFDDFIIKLLLFYYSPYLSNNDWPKKEKRYGCWD